MNTGLRDLFSEEPASISDERLVRECLDGSQEAWGTLIDRYKRLIYSIAVKYHASPDDAADIFQAVCLELFSEMPKLRKAGSLRSWLISVTTHKCYHWKQKQAVTAGTDGTDPEKVAETLAVPPELLEEAEREQILRETVAKLSPRCREMIRLLFYETPALPYAEVARRLGLATGSIGFIRGRCLKRLQQLLEEAGF
ncbi:MAG: RNA polymerase sigma factor [Bryobacteraceae bacterium]